MYCTLTGTCKTPASESLSTFVQSQTFESPLEKVDDVTSHSSPSDYIVLSHFNSITCINVSHLLMQMCESIDFAFCSKNKAVSNKSAGS